ncbi:MAG: MazG nucleotide pyrophosphohydrolase domain-containing protein [Candidatus Gottesmanbacteria bacterium]|nr:MazG nucleotide pyrophosphohydrolase domain-containing protein [Candidatus Gottesmanbacteria bacterium]
MITSHKPTYQKSPFREYFNILSDADKGSRDSKEFGSILILTLVEEIGEMARAYLAEHGRKKTNLAAQRDETYEQELGDILVSILRFARVKNINLHDRIMYSLEKIKGRQIAPKT